MSFSGEGSICSGDSRMLLLEVRLIRESFNDDPAHLHCGSNFASDQSSDIRVGGAIVGGVVVPLSAGVVAPTGGIATGIRPHPYFGVRSTLMEDEAESTRPNCNISIFVI